MDKTLLYELLTDIIEAFEKLKEKLNMATCSRCGSTKFAGTHIFGGCKQLGCRHGLISFLSKQCDCYEENQEDYDTLMKKYESEAPERWLNAWLKREYKE